MQTGSQKHRETDTNADGQTYSNRQTGRLTDRHTARQTDRDRQADRTEERKRQTNTDRQAIKTRQTRATPHKLNQSSKPDTATRSKPYQSSTKLNKQTELIQQ